MLTMWVRSVSTVTCSFSAMSLLTALAEGRQHLFFAGRELLYRPPGFVLLLALAAADHAQHLHDLGGREQGLPRPQAPHGFDDIVYRGRTCGAPRRRLPRRPWRTCSVRSWRSGPASSCRDGKRAPR